MELVYDKTFEYKYLRLQHKPGKLIRKFFDTLGVERKYPYIKFEKMVIKLLIDDLTDKICYDLVYNNAIFHLPNGIGYIVVAEDSMTRSTKLKGFKKRTSLHFYHKGISIYYLQQWQKVMFNIKWKKRLDKEIKGGHYYENIDDIQIKMNVRYGK